jgi:putative ABC transport system permease protein
MLQDLKTACRDLIKSRWFTCITVLTLALGIGANTAIFSVVNRMLLNPLPYPDSSRIVHLRLGSERFAFGYPTPPFLARAWRAEARSLDAIEGFELQDVLAHDGRGARVLHGIKVTPGLAPFLGVQPVLGRALTAEDADPAAPRVALLSYAVWQRDYAGTADVLGRAINLDDVAHVVVGVMPAGASAITGPTSMDIWLPLWLDAAASPTSPGTVEVVARLRPGLPLTQVTGELDAIAARVRDEAGARWLDDSFARIAPPGEFSGLTRSRDIVLALFGAVGLLLLIACANAANLLLARGAARSRAFALRAALGASPWRLARGLLAECLVLALAAAVAGIAVGWATLTVLVRLRPGNLFALDDVHLDPLVLAFTLALSIFTAFLFGSAPALQLARAKFGAALRHGATGTLRSGGARLRKLLVGVQMAISVLLLVGAGLLVRSVYYLQHVDVGFDADDLVTFQLALPRARYENPESRDLAAEQLLERVRSLPGVAAATQAFIAPPNFLQTAGNLEIRGVTLPDADARAPYGFNFVSNDYFSTLGVRLVAGRAFTADEQRTGAALVVSRAAAQRLWPDGNAIGSEVKGRDAWATVVGIAADVAAGGLLLPRDTPLFYWPFKAARVPGFIGGTPGIVLILRTSGDAAAAIGEIRAATQAFDPEIAIRNVLQVETAMAGTIDWPKFNMALFAAFALVALALAAVGLAAVIGYEINERTREIGIRLALGAQARNVRRLSMRHGLVPALAGLACGTAGALAAAKVIASLVHGVAPRDPLTFSAVAGLLLLVALAASWLPALRAAKVDPVRALRAD